MTARTPIPESQLAEWESLAEKAFEGPCTDTQGLVIGPNHFVAHFRESCPESAHIAASRQAVPALVAEVRMLRARLKPFADVATRLGDNPSYGNQNYFDDFELSTFGDCRAALDALPPEE